MASIPLDPEPVGTWLDAEEQRVWRQWLDVTSRLPLALHRGLQEDGDLTLPDFDVLVRLSDVAPARLQLSDLERLLSWEHDRAVRQVAVMQVRGLVETQDENAGGRSPDSPDSWVVLTDRGRAAIEAAAPAHVGLVRYVLFDALTDDQLATLDQVTAELARRLDDLRGAPPG